MKNNSSYKNIQETVSLFGVACDAPYYISTGNQLSGFPSQTFRMDYYTLAICLEGAITLEIDTVATTIQQDSLLIAAPSTIIHFLEASADFRMKLLFFNKSFLLSSFTDPFIVDKMRVFAGTTFNIIKTSPEEKQKFRLLFDYLEDKATTDSPLKDEMVRTLIYYLLLELSELSLKDAVLQTAPDNDNLYFRFIDLVHQHAARHKEVQFYADTLCISAKYLLYQIKKNSAKTPVQLINEVVLQEARLLLSNPELNITDVAYRLNFSSTASFTRFFKRNQGKTPIDYRMGLKSML